MEVSETGKSLDQKFCRECRCKINIKDRICKACGVRQFSPKRETGTWWLPIPSFFIGLFCVAMFIEEAAWASEDYITWLSSAVTSVILGIFTLRTQSKGQLLAKLGIFFSLLSPIIGTMIFAISMVD